jgi:hypothetical protein
VNSSSVDMPRRVESSSGDGLPQLSLFFLKKKRFISKFQQLVTLHTRTRSSAVRSSARRRKKR